MAIFRSPPRPLRKRREGSRAALGLGWGWVRNLCAAGPFPLRFRFRWARVCDAFPGTPSLCVRRWVQNFKQPWPSGSRVSGP